MGCSARDLLPPKLIDMNHMIVFNAIHPDTRKGASNLKSD